MTGIAIILCVICVILFQIGSALERIARAIEEKK
jgi:hypothetical protein